MVVKQLPGLPNSIPAKRAWQATPSIGFAGCTRMAGSRCGGPGPTSSWPLPTGAPGFIEGAWVGRTVRVGDEVQLAATGSCPRWVMTALALADLPKDSGILRTAAQHNQVNVGVYASVLRGGRVRRGDTVRLE
jgi:hypothetical protein